MPGMHWTRRRVMGWVGAGLWGALPSAALAEPVRGTTAAAAFKVTHALAEVQGSGVDGALIVGQDGRLYGTARLGGPHAGGTAFRQAPGGALTVLHAFGAAGDGSHPSGLVPGHDGHFYGTTSEGGAFGQGTVFRLGADGTVVVLHHFQADGSDGWAPKARLLQASDGDFYGTTQQGGAFGLGTVFRISAAGALSVVHSFDNTDGAYPVTGLIQAGDGRLYGTTDVGGRYRLGTAFSLHSGGFIRVLHHFGWKRAKGGRHPSGLVEGPDGLLYGTTTTGGDATRHGLVFRLSRDGEFTVVHPFDARHGGLRPVGNLTVGRDGQLYGVTAGGGINDGGVAYRLSLDGGYTLLHPFAPDAQDGRHPAAGLVEWAAGEFHGSTSTAGANGAGTLYRLRPK